ncbi:MAG: DUF4833 domain-containing protein [Endomicrobia bacterium]|nr:DUF4833 domain-containing protein [Endomicrobiia bacterium]
MKNIKLCALISIVLCLFVSLPFASERSLFKIERSKNANIVQYDANIDGNGQIDKNNPIDSYWLLYASDGRRTEVSAFQRSAYGFSIAYNESGWFDMRMKAVEDRNIKVLLVDGEPKAEMIIKGKNAYLSKIYINSRDGFAGIPTVLYYILTGNEVETGEEIEEKVEVKNQKRGE